jgi:L-threonylcarbamoyladenylate synthase
LNHTEYLQNCQTRIYTQIQERLIDKMINKKINYWQKSLTLSLLSKSLKRDTLSLSTTDTVLGFLGQLSQTSFEKLNALKRDRQNKPYLILIASPQKLHYFVQVEMFDAKTQHFITACWPGPVTLIFQARQNLPTYLTSPAGTIAIRCPAHTPLRTLLSNFDGLFSTSANKSGKPAPTTLNEIEHDLFEKIEYVVVDENNHHTLPLASTILDLSLDNDIIKVIREGSYPISELEKIYGTPFKK